VKTRQGTQRSDRLFKALGHETRIDVLRILNERIASPNEIAKEIGADVNHVSHHVNSLRKDGVIVLVNTEPRRGAVEHYYRAMVPAMIDDLAWSEMPRKSRLVVYRTILQTLMAESAAAEAMGSFDADDAHLSWVPFPVDAQGREELAELLAQSLERIEQIKVSSAERLAESGEKGEAMIAAMMGFERAARPGETGHLRRT
jgi:DNA-binding transcriptional ArsR family regulator